MHRSLNRRQVGRVVGRVLGLWRYPVKSMGAEELAEAEASWHGLAGDRRWAFIRDGVVHSGFPWLTLRERGDLSHYRPSFLDPAQPDSSPTVIRTPSGVTFDAGDPALSAELGPGVRVIKQDRGIFDTLPLSLITTQTARGATRAGRPQLPSAVGARHDRPPPGKTTAHGVICRIFRARPISTNTISTRETASPRRR